MTLYNHKIDAPDARLSRSRNDGAVFGIERPEGEPHWMTGTCLFLVGIAVILVLGVMVS